MKLKEKQEKEDYFTNLNNIKDFSLKDSTWENNNPI